MRPGYLPIILQAKAIDDALELLDLLMVTGHRTAGQGRAGQRRRDVAHPSALARASLKLAREVLVLLEVTDHGGGEVSLDELWEAIDVLTPRRELHAAMQTVEDFVPDTEAADSGTHTRALLADRIATVSGFVKIPTQHIDFGRRRRGRMMALEAMRALPRLLDGRHKIVRGDLGEEVLTGSWCCPVRSGSARTSTCSTC
jgi:hypothetical protein